MGRFCGEIGFGDTAEVAPGIWKDVILEKQFKGDVLRNSIRFSEGESVNDDPSMTNSLSVVASGYALSHIKNIRYVRFNGELWTIDSIEVKRPRLIMTLGGVYNGPEAPTPNAA